MTNMSAYCQHTYVNWYKSTIKAIAFVDNKIDYMLKRQIVVKALYQLAYVF